MALVRWEPFWSRNALPSINSLTRNMSRLFEDILERDEESSAFGWTPRVEVTEFEDHYQVDAELPGMERKDIKVELNNQILTISGEKHAESEKKDRNIHLRERVFGSFSRSFQLPAHVKSEKINAEYKNGVLTLRLPKVEEAKPKQIEIKVD